MDFTTLLKVYHHFFSSCRPGCFLLSWQLVLGDPGAVSRVGKKGRTKVFKYGRKSPWVPTLTGPFPKIQADAGSWLGTKNALYYCAQSANTSQCVLFVCSYVTAIVSITPCLAYAPKKWTRSENFQFDINSPSDPTSLLCQMQANSSEPYPSSWREWTLLLLVYVLHKRWN